MADSPFKPDPSRKDKFAAGNRELEKILESIKRNAVKRPLVERPGNPKGQV